MGVTTVIVCVVRKSGWEETANSNDFYVTVTVAVAAPTILTSAIISASRSGASIYVELESASGLARSDEGVSFFFASSRSAIIDMKGATTTGAVTRACKMGVNIGIASLPGHDEEQRHVLEFELAGFVDEGDLVGVEEADGGLDGGGGVVGGGVPAGLDVEVIVIWAELYVAGISYFALNAAR